MLFLSSSRNQDSHLILSHDGALFALVAHSYELRTAAGAHLPPQISEPLMVSVHNMESWTMPSHALPHWSFGTITCPASTSMNCVAPSSLSKSPRVVKVTSPGSSEESVGSMLGTWDEGVWSSTSAMSFPSWRSPFHSSWTNALSAFSTCTKHIKVTRSSKANALFLVQFSHLPVDTFWRCKNQCASQSSKGPNPGHIASTCQWKIRTTNVCAGIHSFIYRFELCDLWHRVSCRPKLLLVWPKTLYLPHPTVKCISIKYIHSNTQCNSLSQKPWCRKRLPTKLSLVTSSICHTSAAKAELMLHAPTAISAWSTGSLSTHWAAVRMKRWWISTPLQAALPSRSRREAMYG